MKTAIQSNYKMMTGGKIQEIYTIQIELLTVETIDN